MQVEQLLHGVRSVSGRLDDQVMVELMAFSGLRPGEVIALLARDIDLRTRRIRINRTATIDVHGKPTVGEPEHGERREVRIAPHLLEPLTALLDQREATSLLITSA